MRRPAWSGGGVVSGVKEGGGKRADLGLGRVRV